MHSPVEQFTIKILFAFNLFGYDIAFTNSSLFMVLAVLVSVSLLTYAMRPASMVPGRLQNVAEMMFEFVADMVRSNVGSEGRRYFPFIFSVFVFVLFFISSQSRLPVSLVLLLLLRLLSVLLTSILSFFAMSLAL